MMNEQDVVRELDFGVRPEAAISGAVLLASEEVTFLLFNAVKPRSDGYYEPAGVAVAHFPRCTITMFGYPNDEALPGHPLYAQLGAYGIYEILKSSWISNLERRNQMAFPQGGRWDARHFLISFHDSTFECIAHNLELEVQNEPWPTLLGRVASWIAKE
jgi:hypothetical protein